MTDNIDEMRRQVQKRIDKEAKEYSKDPDKDSNKNAPPGKVTIKFIHECLFANELGDGVLYATLFRDRFLFCKNSQEWYSWSGHFWQRDIMGSCLAAVEDIVEYYLGEYRRIAGQIADIAKGTASGDVEKLKKQPDAFIIDGQGIAHPRRLGLAAHLGLFFDKPTIGCAKSRLTGYFEDPPPEKGAYTLLKDKKGMIPETSHEPKITNHEVIGAVVRSRSNVEPLFVSVGNKCLLKDAIKITLDCAIKYRLPEPTRLAHQTVSKLRLKA